MTRKKPPQKKEKIISDEEMPKAVTWIEKHGGGFREYLQEKQRMKTLGRYL